MERTLVWHDEPAPGHWFCSECGEEIIQWKKNEGEKVMRWVWWYSPEWAWFGWRGLWPIALGGDEYGRRTLVLGWLVTGRVVVAISRSGYLYPPDEEYA